MISVHDQSRTISSPLGTKNESIFGFLAKKGKQKDEFLIEDFDEENKSVSELEDELAPPELVFKKSNTVALNFATLLGL